MGLVDSPGLLEEACLLHFSHCLIIYTYIRAYFIAVDISSSHAGATLDPCRLGHSRTSPGPVVRLPRARLDALLPEAVSSTELFSFTYMHGYMVQCSPVSQFSVRPQDQAVLAGCQQAREMGVCK